MPGTGRQNFKKDKKWHENLFELSNKVGLLDYYETMYRTGSRVEHGSWYHLKFYHLIEQETQYEPELKNIMPHPQLIIGVNLICLRAMMDYLKCIQVKEESFSQLIQKIIDWHVNLSKKRDESVDSQD